MKKIIVIVLLMITSVTLIACRSGHDIETFEIIDMHHDNARLAYIDHDHWHGELPTIRFHHPLTVTANIVSKDGETINLNAPGSLHQISAEVYEDGRTDVVRIENKGNHIVLSGHHEGVTEIVFHWSLDGEIQYTTPPTLVMVLEGHGHDHSHPISTFELYYNDTRIAYMHGDHWHGSLPSITLGDDIELSAFIRDSHDHEIAFGDHNAFAVALAPGATTGIVELINHIDHVDIEGISVGSTQIVFQWIHDGEVKYTTPPLTIRVTE